MARPGSTKARAVPPGGTPPLITRLVGAGFALDLRENRPERWLQTVRIEVKPKRIGRIQLADRFGQGGFTQAVAAEAEVHSSRASGSSVSSATLTGL
jgi:hypothetical protein